MKALLEIEDVIKIVLDLRKVESYMSGDYK